jgi:hypothetical protein
VLGLFKTKEKPMTQSLAFSIFKEQVIAAVNEAKRHNVWDTTLGDFLSSYGQALGGGR